MVCNRLSLSMGSRSVAAGANPSLVSGRGQGTQGAEVKIQIDCKSVFINEAQCVNQTHLVPLKG